MTLHIIISNFTIGLAIIFMSGAIFKSNTLVELLKGSKAEKTWIRSRMFLILLTLIYLIIMIARLVGDRSPITDAIDDGPNHGIVMNGAFLITGLMMISVVTLDIKAFNSLFKLLEDQKS